MVASTKVDVLCVIVTSSLVEDYRRFKGASCLQSDMWAMDGLEIHGVFLCITSPERDTA